MTSDNVERMLPLYEAKMIHHYDHRWATYEPDGSVRDVTLEEKRNPDFVVMPRYWVREAVVRDRLAELPESMLGVRDITNSTNERTVIATPFPAAAVGNNLPIAVGGKEDPCLAAVLSSFALDFLARPKVGGVHLNFFITNQLPVLHPATFDGSVAWLGQPLRRWVEARVRWLLSADGWRDPSERSVTRAELDAAMFHLYGIERDDVDYIMETFPIVKRKDIAAYGEYRTKRKILEIYDAMARAQRTGTTYESSFDAEVTT